MPTITMNRTTIAPASQKTGNNGRKTRRISTISRTGAGVRFTITPLLPQIDWEDVVLVTARPTRSELGIAY